MGEVHSRVADSWRMPLTRLFDHKLVRLLSESDAAALDSADSAEVLYDELRSFLALKKALSAGDPPEALRPANEALLDFAARLFAAAHQVLLNDGLRDEGAKPAPKAPNGQHQPVVPTRQFLLEWQLVRLKAARERLIMELAEVSERDEELFRSLVLPETVGAEIEIARLRISNVWKELDEVFGGSSRRRGIRARFAA